MPVTVCARGFGSMLCFVLTHVLLVAVSFGNEITYNPVLSVDVQIDVRNVTIDFSCKSNTTDIAIEFCGTYGVRPDENRDVVLDAFLQTKFYTSVSTQMKTTPNIGTTNLWTTIDFRIIG